VTPSLLRSFSLSRIRPPPSSILFPYTTLFRSAGGMYASARDLARWLLVHLNGGRLDGRQVLPAAALAEAHRPVAEVDDRYGPFRSEEHTSELQSRENLVCRLLLEKKKNTTIRT